MFPAPHYLINTDYSTFYPLPNQQEPTEDPKQDMYAFWQVFEDHAVFVNVEFHHFWLRYHKLHLSLSRSSGLFIHLQAERKRRD